MNPPPQQMFGDYGSESPFQFSGSYFAENDGQGSMEDNGDPKRRRIARVTPHTLRCACDMCRKKKIKCDGKMPKCSHCINYKTDCIFTHQEKKRNPPKGAKYIEGLENRLGRMESLLKLSGLLNAEDGHTDLGTLEKRLADKALSNQTEQQRRPSTSDNAASKSPTLSDGGSQNGILTEAQSQSHTETSKDPEPSKRNSASSPKLRKQDEEVEAVAELMCSLVTNNYGETRFIASSDGGKGSSSGFSIFSPKGIRWVNDKTGDDSFQRMMTESNLDEGSTQFSPWKPEIFGDIFTRKLFRRLPPLSEALSLLKDYFENFNCMFPLFHEPTFMHLVHLKFSQNPYEGSSWWASLNCVLAIAHRLRVMSNLVPQEEDQKAWGFMKNALGVLAELTMRNTDLLSVQALLGMALFLLGTPNPQPSFHLVAAATRLAHAIGLHKKGSTFNLNPVEIEQRKRVFWIAFLLDKE
ncbi:MAG: hypothetical protein LQ340_005677 [Diploschistes diacapsis]|nr:MAG: hypothetical protein LQ340_005677 [Diploschistes diacapsis]